MVVSLLQADHCADRLEMLERLGSEVCREIAVRREELGEGLRHGCRGRGRGWPRIDRGRVARSKHGDGFGVLDATRLDRFQDLPQRFHEGAQELGCASTLVGRGPAEPRQDVLDDSCELR